MSGREVPKVVVTGDSAGGNLATAMTLMVIESATTNRRPTLVQAELPVPDGLVLLYPGLDMNIGNWMSDEQMSLIKDRRMRGTNKDYLRDKSMQYNDLVGTPHQSDDEDDDPDDPTSKPTNGETTLDNGGPKTLQSPHPEYSHATRQSWSMNQPPSPVSKRDTKSLSHRPEPMRTRLAMASMLSYFNDRVLTPEMMRAMIILYIGPHNRPDFSQDYLLSPILAPDILLQRFPKTYFLTGERDPLVDDTVIFAGRLRRVKRALHAQRASQGADEKAFDEKDVAEVVLIPGISHGFTQFPLLYPPAWKLIDRCARWALDLLNAAEARRLREQAAFFSAARNNRHHRRVESSGDEDRPLEIAMTRMRGRTIGSIDEAAKIKRGSGKETGTRTRTGTGTGTGTPSPSTPPAEDERTTTDTDGADGVNAKNGFRKRRSTVGHARFGSGSSTKSKSFVKLDSSDDLLGRRMQGLAGPLTGVHDDDDD